MAEVVDWALAARTGARLAPSGPATSSTEALEVVHELRSLAREAIAPVAATTAMVAPHGSAVTEVVDRPTWVASNVAGLEVLFEPVADRLDAARTAKARLTAPITAVGSRVTALQMGVVLGWLSGKVLGQFEVFAAGGSAGGPSAGVAEERAAQGFAEGPAGGPGEGTPRLLLVAPNIVATQTALGLPGRDFRLWVCLHEETHRVQFGAVPWLAAHLTEQVHTFLAASPLSTTEVLARVRPLVGDPARVRDRGSLLDLVQTPEQRAILDHVTALMTVLEGHADVMMDQVGPDVVPSVAEIRRRFDHRRSSPPRIDGLMRRLLGLDAKMRQYAEGALFVRGVITRVGTDGFNRIWESPDNLPDAAEIADPALWVSRLDAA